MEDKGINLMMEDYKLKNARVEMVNVIYARTIVQQVIVFGALLSFCIFNFSIPQMMLYVNFVCCIALPLVSCSVVACSFSYGIKILAYGEYLFSLEKRMDKIQKSYSGSSEVEYINWESWRLRNGIARDKWVHHDTVYNIALIFITSFFIALWRLYIIYSVPNGRFWMFTISLCVVSIYTFTVIIVLSKKLNYRRKREERILFDTFEDSDLQAMPNVTVLEASRKSLGKFIKCGTLFIKKGNVNKTVFKRIFNYALNVNNNSKLANDSYALLIAYWGNIPVGKLLIGTNKAISEKTGIPQGYFSLFDCINNQKVADQIFSIATEWYRKRGVKLIVGPESCTFDDFSKGLQTSGFDNKSFILNPTNPEYYEGLLLNVGLKKRRDHYAYRMDLDNLNMELLDKMNDLNKKRLELNIVNAKFGRSSLAKTIDDLHKILSNEIPDELDQLSNPSKEDLKSVLDIIRLLSRREYFQIAYVKNDPIGLMIAVPNYYELLKGNSHFRFFIKLLFRKWTINSSRILFVYIVPKYQRRGVLYNLLSSMQKSLLKNGIKDVELSTVDEKNELCNNTANVFKLKPHKIYREYELEI